MQNLIWLFIGAVLINNFVLTRFLGICPFLGVSRKTSTAVGMGLAVTFVMVVSTLVCWPLQYYVLIPLNLPFLKYAAFILIIAALVQFIEMYLKKYQQGLYKAFGIYLPLITTNCAVLGVVLITLLLGHNFIESVVFSFAAGIGFLLALAIMSGIRERLDTGDIPEAFQGIPIALIIAGLLALAFSGFAGLK